MFALTKILEQEMDGKLTVIFEGRGFVVTAHIDKVKSVCQVDIKKRNDDEFARLYGTMDFTLCAEYENNKPLRTRLYLKDKLVSLTRDDITDTMGGLIQIRETMKDIDTLFAADFLVGRP